MTFGEFVRMYAIGVVVAFGLDLLWLGVIARGFYQKHLGHLMRPDVQWAPAIAFYLIYVAALVVFVAAPAIEKQSVARAAAYGAFFGVAAYAAFDLTGLALFKGFTPAAAFVDLAWGACLSAAVSAAIAVSARW